jgi:hypothetical protein
MGIFEELVEPVDAQFLLAIAELGEAVGESDEKAAIEIEFMVDEAFRAGCPGVGRRASRFLSGRGT